MKAPITFAAVALAGALTLTACGSSNGKTIDLVGYSTPQKAYTEIEKAFEATPAGKDVTFAESYGASGDQSRAVENGQSADYVNFALEPDLTRLTKAGIVADDWNKGATHGIVADSTVVLVVRKGNPKHITGWADLIKPGVSVVTPNPLSSGGARWNLLAAYGQIIANGGDEAKAKQYVTELFQHAAALPDSARNALTAFTGGTGDVLLSYESEAILARQKGTAVDYVVPSTSIKIETPAAVTKDAGADAKAFLDFVTTKPAQEIFQSFGYRPVLSGITTEVKGANDPKNPFPVPAKFLTIADFGGWKVAAKKFFDPDNGLISLIQKATGKTK